MTIASVVRCFQAAFSRWGVGEYVVFSALWLTLSLPLYFMGWGVASLLGLPLVIFFGMALAGLASWLLKGSPKQSVRPRPGFPIEIMHSSLGVFRLSGQSNERYDLSVDWCGVATQLSLSIDNPESIQAALSAATAITASSASVNARVAAYLIQELLPNINEERLAQEMHVLQAENFLKSISLQMITVYQDEAYEFLYGDGDLLGGHWIEVHGTISAGPTYLDTPG